MQSFKLKTGNRGIASVILDRPEQHNAFDDVMITELIELLGKLERDDRVRVLVLRAAAKGFPAGADLNWMRRVPGGGRQDSPSPRVPRRVRVAVSAVRSRKTTYWPGVASSRVVAVDSTNSPAKCCPFGSIK